IDLVGHRFRHTIPERLRMFGGSTNHWGGHCTPLESDDFERRDWIAYSGWPYSYSELYPFYVRAHDVLGLGSFDYDPAQFGLALGLNTFPFDERKIKSTVSRYNRLPFGSTYGEQLDCAENVQVILYAEVSAILMKDAISDDVDCVLVKSIAGNQFRIKA